MGKLVGRSVKTKNGIATVISQIGVTTVYYTVEYGNGDIGWLIEAQFELLPV